MSADELLRCDSVRLLVANHKARILRDTMRAVYEQHILPLERLATEQINRQSTCENTIKELHDQIEKLRSQINNTDPGEKKDNSRNTRTD